MLKYATGTGFYFYNSLEGQRLMRMRHPARCMDGDAEHQGQFPIDDGECRLASKGSYLYEFYESPDQFMVESYKSKEELNEWKADILKLLALNTKTTLVVNRPASPRKSP